MKRVRLICWKPEDATAGAEILQKAGYEVDFSVFESSSLKSMKINPPDCIVIDLSRVPSQGRDLGLLFRKTKSTRFVPLVFVEGKTEKVAAISKLLPDATFTNWKGIKPALQKALARPIKNPVVPDSSMAGYAGVALPKKLGIKSDSVVALLHAPEDFAISDLPAGVTVGKQARGNPDITLWFVRSKKELESKIDKMGKFAEKGGLWILWPKKASGVQSDLTQAVVRKIGLAKGLVDFKIASIDKTWSGLRFSIKK